MSQTKSALHGPCASAPEVIARLQDAIDANETSRIVLREGLDALQSALDHHLNEIDAHLRRLHADLAAK